MLKKLSAYKIYLLFSGIRAMLFSALFTATIVYQIEKVHLDPFQLVLVGTTLEVTLFIFEIPTGIVADIYSRKLSIIIGAFLTGVGFIVEGSIPTFIAILSAQVLWGIGDTFVSGAIDAWIAEEDRTRSLDKIYIKGSQVGQIGSVAGIILSVVLANFSISLPIVSSGCMFIILAFFLAFFMPEQNFKPSAPNDLNTFDKMLHTIKSSTKFIKSKPIIVLLFAITFFYGLSSEGYDRLYTAHFLKDTALPQLWSLQPVTWFGGFGIAGMLLSAGAMQFIIKKLEQKNTLQSVWILLSANIFFIFSMIIFAITKNFYIMVAAYLSTNMLRTINEPIFNAWLNSHIDDNARATVLSTNGQVDALGQILGGPIIGIIASKVSISIGIACTALLLTPVILLYIFSITSDRNNQLKHFNKEI